ncbi:pathogenesis-related protein PR-1-like [Humulus lupulus]|uniref:pathogenesis-related protein PR-1-like n=1 Tax=Humulus lupulus TaxID=3486 RepID=UPI002B40AF6E|nr:pathogenesis-related protein PR-1-like [Humulus lupulus]
MAKLRSSIAITTTALLLFIAISSSSATVHNVAKYVSQTRQQFLKPQNTARALLRMQALQWDSRLEKYAQWYANKRRSDCALEHSNGPYGENIFWGSGRGWSPVQAVSAWIDERKWYKYGSNSCARGQICGHYTQIVWRQTKRIGCARVDCVGGKGVFMICNYDPPGNYYGERPY